LNTTTPTVGYVVGGYRSGPAHWRYQPCDWNETGYWLVVLATERGDIHDPEARLFAAYGCATPAEAAQLAIAWATREGVRLE
jgi:hypothetical protein